MGDDSECGRPRSQGAGTASATESRAREGTRAVDAWSARFPDGSLRLECDSGLDRPEYAGRSDGAIVSGRALGATKAARTVHGELVFGHKCPV